MTDGTIFHTHEVKFELDLEDLSSELGSTTLYSMVEFRARQNNRSLIRFELEVDITTDGEIYGSPNNALIEGLPPIGSSSRFGRPLLQQIPNLVGGWDKYVELVLDSIEEQGD